MRSLYALHPDTVLQLHERGAVLYGQPLALSLGETEERLMQEEYPRIVIDPVLCRTADAQRVLRRIAAVHPGTEITWVRANMSLRGLPLEALVQELRGEGDLSAQQPRCAVIVAPGDAAAGGYCALAIAAHLARAKDTLLLETDTVDPVYARALRLRPTLTAFLEGTQPADQRRPGWPGNLTVIAAPARPELLLEYGMAPLAQRIQERTGRSNVVVRASANLGDRGLIASLPLASDVLLCSPEGDGQYSHWVSQLAPGARMRTVSPRKAAMRPSKAAAAGALLWGEGGAEDAG
ncbi:MAG: hypothetical protein M0Z66_05650 [Thermaerobacter sp.]|nr:hypothetical protein [Thermaerobacter sp.]